MMAAREGWPYASSGRPQGSPQPGELDAARRDAEECQILNPACRSNAARSVFIHQKFNVGFYPME
jgi:hypothetical protein